MDTKKTRLVLAALADVEPSLGVTEPGAIAFTAACAARAAGGKAKSVEVWLNSGIYKNSFTCAVPGADGMGCALAAAMGAVCGDPDKRLQALDGASEEDAAAARAMVEEGRAAARLQSISSEIFIKASVLTDEGEAEAVTKGLHDRLVSLKVNGRETLEAKTDKGPASHSPVFSDAGFEDAVGAVCELEDSGVLALLLTAARQNEKLFEEGRRAGLIPLTEARLGSAPEGLAVREAAELITCGAIEARVRGAGKSAMAITGSGSHGILCTVPVLVQARAYGAGDDALCRALLLSALTTIYIKEHSGRLSAICGCVLAGGTGAALGLTYLGLWQKLGRAPKTREALPLLSNALNSMAASVTGMICHGGNTGCSLKASVGVNMAFGACRMALRGAGAESVHGILGPDPDATVRNMGLIAQGMQPLEADIVRIMSCKGEEKLL
ncbi:MAG: serine dehydratase subunit alpha family protein [Clostridia bacterium]|nr:serine dehydratase subunit alpha family protein [Clostridia bacterium]